MPHLIYKVLLRKEENGEFTIMIPTLFGYITRGKTLDEALDLAKESISLYIDSLKKSGAPIPTDENTLEYNIIIE